MKIHFVICSLCALFVCSVFAAEKPNLVFILADDMGYGDVAHAGGKIATPNCDRLAAEGMRFTDAHTTSSVCTPTRYGILTGRYNWRSRLKNGVLWPPSKPLISKDRVTLPKFLQQQGYHTACVGKWHLGLDWQMLPNGQKGKADDGRSIGKGWNIDYTKPITHGPTHIGFDYFWGIPASLDMPPYVYIKNDMSTAVPTKIKAFYRPGPAAADFEAVNCLRDFAAQSRNYIKQQAADKSKPFFLYLPLTSPHTPHVPSKRWQGKSGFNTYGDFVMETDWVVGEVLAELDEQGIAGNTLVLFTTDNGCSPAAKIPALIAKGHKPNADWRGHKADIYEGGHRVPFIVRWPGKVKAGSTSDSIVVTTDFYKTAAEILNAAKNIPNAAAEDSFSFLPDLLKKGKTARTTAIHHSVNGSFAIRHGHLKLILAPGSGGWSAPRGKNAWKVNPGGIQLYNLKADPSEKNDINKPNLGIVNILVDLLQKEISNGRSTPGKPVNNEGEIPFNKKITERFPQLKNQTPK
ncbi:MAG: arylsulfatase [Planctomycetes bacterium]|nr:arylsulfatase [Planctomycetota bacterium]